MGCILIVGPPEHSVAAPQRKNRAGHHEIKTSPLRHGIGGGNLSSEQLADLPGEP
jgi:hypothetical protein